MHVHTYSIIDTYTAHYDSPEERPCIYPKLKQKNSLCGSINIPPSILYLLIYTYSSLQYYSKSSIVVTELTLGFPY